MLSMGTSLHLWILFKVALKLSAWLFVTPEKGLYSLYAWSTNLPSVLGTYNSYDYSTVQLLMIHSLLQDESPSYNVQQMPYSTYSATPPTYSHMIEYYFHSIVHEYG